MTGATRALLAILFASAVLGACGRRPPPPLPWQRVDLLALRPEVETSATTHRWRKPLQRTTAFLGPRGQVDLAAAPPEVKALAPLMSAGAINALEQVAGTAVRFRLRLGSEPWFSFTPLPSETQPCVCVHRVRVRPAGGGDGGDATEVASWQPSEPIPPAPAAVEVELARWAGQEVDLILALDAVASAAGDPSDARAAARGRALWGSPAVYGRAAAADPVAERRAARPAAERPNILLIGADTLRADALGAWGRTPSTTPALDRLAAESDVWLEAFSCFNVTNPSFISTLTGLYGKNHGSYDLRTPLPDSRTTLAELLAGAGYDSLAVISARHLGPPSSGLGQGFGEVAQARGQFAAERAVDATLDWLAAREGGAANAPEPRPFFVWLHLFDPHTPHTPPRPYAEGFRPEQAAGLAPVADWVPFRTPGLVAWAEPRLGGHHALYAGEVASVDRQVDRLLGWLDSRGLLADTVVAFVSDHGENLEEHGIRYRHAGLWDSTTHVPLMIRWPGARREGRRLSGLVQNVDLFPTLARAAGVQPPPSDGVDLRDLTGGRWREGQDAASKREGRRAVFAEHSERLGVMVRTRAMKLIRSAGTPFVPAGVSLYDLRADPREEKNLAGQGLPAEAELGALLDRWLADRRSEDDGGTPRELSAEEIERLRALGYL